MAVEINISGTNIRGNARVLNDVNISGKSSVNIGIQNSEMYENAKVLNNLDVENGQVDVELKDLSLGEGVEFMNGKKFTEKTYHQQTSSTSKQSSYKQASTERTTKTSDKNASFFSLLKRVLKSIFKPKNTEKHYDEVIYPRKTHKDFENEVSMDGTLKNLDPTEILQSVEKDSTENTRKPENPDMSR